MNRITIVRMISAPPEVVFRTVADINQFSQAIPHIVKVEILTAGKLGVGTRFRETRQMKNKQATTELEVTEYIENKSVRMVADSHGTVWDTVFSVEPEKESTKLTTVMDARAYKLLPKIMYPFIRGMVQKAIEKDMDSVKAFCER